MNIIARFVGVDKYLDGGIRDLTGAGRDATALWALFTDTIKDIDSKLLVDSNATLSDVVNALDETLGAANEDDTVIFSFAGHGSHDHRLILHDTNLTSLSTTSLSMEDLANRFKSSKAKNIICILDCCFSGGAPARVLENSPIPRDIQISVKDLAGKGRVIISACNEDESSYETAGTGHGLLTKALIDVLQSAEKTINLPTAIDKVMETVRAEAVRMGVAQTPVIFGTVEGGMVLPALKADTNYFTAFPEKTGIKITENVNDLLNFNIPQEVVSEWSKQFNGKLNELQVEAINEYRILDGESVLIVAPTSSGKTFTGEVSAVKAILDGKKAVFLFPYRALTNEKYEQFLELYGETLGMRVIRCTGDYLDSTESFLKGKYDLALLTYEMFLNIAINSGEVLNSIGLVVLDEGQFITDPNRGISVELLLTNLISARERGISPQIVVLSAVIGDTNSFEDWLGCKKLTTNKRPVPLTEGVLDRGGVFQHLNASGTVSTTQLLPSGEIRVRREKPSSQDVIVPLVKLLVGQGENVIVFRNQRGTAQGCAGYLSDELGLPPAQDALSALPSSDLSQTSARLRACLQGGTAFHNSNLTREEKTVVEGFFREKDSKIRVLGATTTVAAGINTPASTVILAEQEFMGEDGRPFSVAEYKNMAGRAGRLGFNEEGKSIILADNELQREQLFQRYVMGQLDSLHSSFDPKDIDTWLIRLLAQVKKVPRAEVIRLLANTYGGYLASKNNPDWKTQTTEHLEKLLERMISLDLVEEEGETLQLTLLGRACGRSALKFQSAMRLVEVIKNNGADLTPEKILAIIQLLPESDNGYTPMFKRGRSESVRVSQVAQRFGNGIVSLLQRNAEDEFDYLARCKRAAILFDWINGVAVERIEQDYTVSPYAGAIRHGDIRKFADATRFHLRSAHQIAMLVFPDTQLDEKAIDTLLKQLEVGMPTESLGLLLFPVSFSRGEYLSLYKRGINTVEELTQAPEEVLSGILSKTRVEEIKKIKEKNNVPVN